MELNFAFDTVLEETIIGSMLYDPQCIAEVAEVVKPHHFYHQQYQRLCEKIYELWQQDETRVNIVELSPFLEEHQIPVSKMMEIIDSIVTTAAIRHHALRLRDLWALREAIRIAHDLTQQAHLREREAIRETISNASEQLARTLDQTTDTETMRPMSDALMDFAEEFEEIYQKGEGITGIPTGFKGLDAKTSGLQKSDLIIIGGRPSMGKTAFALQLARNISINQGLPTLFFSLEMSEKSLIRRMVAAEARINLQKINSGLINESEYERYVQALGVLNTPNLVIDDQPGLSVAEMKAKARRMKRERGLACIIIDYLQYIKGSGRKERHLEIGEITRQLKAMAKDFDIPVIVLSQLSRAVEQRNDKRPMMSDLRESGDIEQDADLIMFLYRDEYYNPNTTDAKNMVELIIGKQRNGPTGTVNLTFIKEWGIFSDPARDMMSPWR